MSLLDLELNKRYRISVGPSLRTGSSSTPLVTCQYNFQPESLDREALGELLTDAEGGVHVRFSAVSEAGVPAAQQSFKGAYRESSELVLLMDGDGFTLERVRSAVAGLLHEREVVSEKDIGLTNKRKISELLKKPKKPRATKAKAANVARVAASNSSASQEIGREQLVAEVCDELTSMPINEEIPERAVAQSNDHIQED
jgi:hypothetical protein